MRDERADGVKTGRAEATAAHSHHINILFDELRAKGIEPGSLSCASLFPSASLDSASAASASTLPDLDNSVIRHDPPPMETPQVAKKQRRSGTKTLERPSTRSMSKEEKLKLYATWIELKESEFIERDRIHIRRHQKIGKCFQEHCNSDLKMFEERHGSSWNVGQLDKKGGMYGCDSCRQNDEQNNH